MDILSYLEISVVCKGHGFHSYFIASVKRTQHTKERNYANIIYLKKSIVVCTIAHS